MEYSIFPSRPDRRSAENKITEEQIMLGIVSALYGVIVYALFFCTFLYAIAFVGDLPVPKTIDSGTPGPMLPTLIIDVLLLALFAVQHSVMARPWFKRQWTKLVPWPVERTTYVLFASIALVLLFRLWQPMPQPVWTAGGPGGIVFMQTVFWGGFALALASTFMINHFELFGLRQVYARMRGHELPKPVFKAPYLYKRVRHPIYLGFLLAFWATPNMTAGHLLFAVGTTCYILMGIYFEERDLIALFGDQYRRYRQQVSMLLPIARRSKQSDTIALRSEELG
jgi:protein-S-isoprenylcysteine O-methyltransferase Ste14